MIGIFGNIIKTVLGPLGRTVISLIPKGKTTGTGGILAAVGTVGVALTGGPHIPVITSGNIVEIINAIAALIVALGTFVTAFGIGRHEATQG